MRRSFLVVFLALTLAVGVAGEEPRLQALADRVRHGDLGHLWV